MTKITKIPKIKTSKHRIMNTIKISTLMATTLMLLTTSLGGFPSASAQPPEGTILFTFNSGVNSVGLGFDGTLLYTPNGFSSNNLLLFQTNGLPAGNLPLTCTIQNLSFDAGRGVFWAADGQFNIYQIDLAGNCVLQFTITAAQLIGDCDIGFCAGLVDGIDYDERDDTIRFSPDASQRIYSFSATTGLLVGFFDVNDPPNDVLPVCGFNYSSGIATGTSNILYNAADGCQSIFKYDKDTGVLLNSFPVPAQRNEGMECDNVTFANQGIDAIWVKDLVGPITAFAVPKDTCQSQPLPFEAEKFYTETNVNVEAGEFGTRLSTVEVDVEGEIVDKFLLKAVIKKKDGTVSSYNPGQYYAVTKVTLLQDVDKLWITELFGDCTDRGTVSLSKVNPDKVPGGALVAIMDPDGNVSDLSSELVKSGDLFLTDSNNNGITDNAEVHIDDPDLLKEGSMVFLYVKFGPGLKGLDMPDAPLNMCKNQELIQAQIILNDEPVNFEGSVEADLIVIPK